MIDKSLRMKPAIQGGGPNYLGKQKMVTAPKKWLSSPDHEPAELAYITEKEKDILIDLDLYGSLNGKPNRGPAGIMSLQGDLGGYGGSGGSSSSGGGGGGGGGEGRPHFMSYTPPPPTVTRSRIQEEKQKQFEEDKKAKVREILTRGRGTDIPGERLFEDRISKGAVNEIDPETGKYNAEAIQKAAKTQARERALGIATPVTTEQITSLPLGTRIADFVPTQTRVENLQKAGSQFLPSFSMEGAKQYATNKLRNFAVKTGLGELGITGVLPQTLIPYGFSKIFGGRKDPLRTVKSQIAKFKKPSLTTEKEYTKNLVKGPPKDDRDGPRVKTVAEKVATGEGLESGAKLLGLDDAQQNYIRKIISGKDRRELQMIAGKAKISIDSGKASQIEKDVFQIIQEYLV